MSEDEPIKLTKVERRAKRKEKWAEDHGSTRDDDGNPLRGSAHRNSKFDEATVLYIRTLYKTGIVSIKHIADSYGVSKSTVQSIIERKSWSHI